MRKRDTLLLLSPVLVFILVAIALLGFAARFNRHHDPVPQKEHLEKFQRFVDDVKAGRRQLTQDGMLDMMRRSEKVATDEWNISVAMVEYMYWVGWLSAVGGLLQFAAVFQTWKRSRKLAAANSGLHWTRR